MKTLVQFGDERKPTLRILVSEADPEPADPAASHPTKQSTHRGGLPIPPIPPGPPPQYGTTTTNLEEG